MFEPSSGRGLGSRRVLMRAEYLSREQVSCARATLQPFRSCARAPGLRAPPRVRTLTWGPGECLLGSNEVPGGWGSTDPTSPDTWPLDRWLERQTWTSFLLRLIRARPARGPRLHVSVRAAHYADRGRGGHVNGT